MVRWLIFSGCCLLVAGVVGFATPMLFEEDYVDELNDLDWLAYLKPEEASQSSMQDESDTVLGAEGVEQQHPDLKSWILSTESMNDEEREFWMERLPKMTANEVEALHTISAAEREQLANIDGKYAVVYGKKLSADERYREAVAAYSKALSVIPNRPDIYALRGFARQRMGDYRDAINDYNMAIQLQPDGDYLLRRGVLRMKIGEVDKAIGDFSSAVGLNDRDEAVLVMRGRALSVAGKYDQAISDLNAVISMNPKNSEALQERAWLRGTCPDGRYRNGTLAVDDAMTAFGLPDGNRVGVLDALAAAHAESGSFDEAVEWQEKAIAKSDSEDKELVFRLELYKSNKPFHYKQTAEESSAIQMQLDNMSTVKQGK